MPGLDPVALTQALVRCPSVTPADAGALDVVQRAAEGLGFACRRMVFAEPGTAPVDNLYAVLGADGPTFCFAGHTDVVPPGDPAAWSVDPFAGALIAGRLVGRGAADMKSGIAAFLAGVDRFLARAGPSPGRIALLITGDEEADAVNGTRKVLEALAAEGVRLDACLVGEPTCPTRLGEAMKIGRRGSLTARLVVHGVQGHTAYPQQADNPVNRLVRMLALMLAEPLDRGTAHFDPSNLEVTTVDVGNPAGNVIPARAAASLNLRFNDAHSGASLERWLRGCCEAVGGRYELAVRVSGESFLTPPGSLVAVVAGAVERVAGLRPALSTSGGTSDARFIRAYCPVVEFGLVNRTIHQVDESAALADIERLADIYAAVLEDWFAARAGGAGC